MRKTRQARDVELDATIHSQIQLEDLRGLEGRNISVRIGEDRITIGKVTRIHVHSRGDDQKRAAKKAVAADRRQRGKARRKAKS